MFLSEYVVVALTEVKASEARCISCHQPFTKENVFTSSGLTEIAISGMCEKCFDSLFQDDCED